MNITKQTNNRKGRTLLLFLTALCCNVQGWAQYLPTGTPAYSGGSRSYIRTRQMTTTNEGGYHETVEYLDGLGRPLQTVRRRVTPSGHDLADFTDYDSRGNVWRTWKATPTGLSDGAFVPDLPRRAPAIHGDARPYVERLYTARHPGEAASITGMGEAFKEHPDLSFRKTNSQVFPYACPRFGVDDRGLPVHRGNWPDGELALTSHTDGDGRRRLTFTDKLGRVLLERAMSGGVAHDTRYVYDARGDLRCVLPPSLGTDSIPETDFREHGYAYTYDALHRLTGKRLPGCGWTEYAYDTADRPAFTRDAEGRCTFAVLDPFGREALRGTCAAVPQSLDGVVKARFDREATGVAGTGYTVTGTELESPALLQANYYDTYDFLSLPAVQPHADSLAYRKEAGHDERHIFFGVEAYGRLTGTVTRVPGTDKSTITAYYYDDKGNVVQARSTNHLGGYDAHCYSLTFTGKPARHLHTHSDAWGRGITELYTYVRDAGERVRYAIHQTTDGAVSLLEYGYDEECRLKSALFYNTGTRQEYAYNVRDWTTAIGGTHFTQTLHYADGAGTPQYGGNISGMAWMAGDSVRHAYTYRYDALNRLTQAVHNEGKYSTSYTYDRIGNIKSVKRVGQTGADAFGRIDDLTMDYEGHRLRAVTDAAAATAYGGGFEFKDGANAPVEYFYDSNGNLVKDLNRNIRQIEYNSLNLSSSIRLENGDRIDHLYAGDGTKLRTTRIVAGDTAVTDYCGNVVYENGVAVRLMTGNGYLNLADTTYHCYVRDHQGNVRVVAGKGGTVEEVNHYYPYGGTFASPSASVQPYKYNGKELDSALQWYDYGARMYDPAIGRWHAVDPLAEKYTGMTAYGYCAGNPVRYIDPDGKGWNEAWPFLKNSFSGSFSMGLRFGVQADLARKKVGADFDMGSVKMSDKGMSVTNGFSINVGIVGIDIHNEAYQLDKRLAIEELGASANILGFSLGHDEIITYNSTGKYYEEISKESKVNSDYTIGASIAVGVGGELKIDLKNVYNFIVELFK